jgi:hypothetical protein
VPLGSSLSYAAAIKLAIFYGIEYFTSSKKSRYAILSPPKIL